MLERLFNASWYGPWQWTWVLWPLSVLVGFITKRKRQAFLSQPKHELAAPIIVVGNITIGGTGKTPVVQSIVRFLQSQGYKPGIISRGYGGELNTHPHLIQITDTSAQVGDEPYMLYQSLNVPVVVDPDRHRGVRYLLDKTDVNVIISDDGLQHYTLHRDYEVCVIDGARQLGNGQLLPVGPLREHKARLDSVDYVLRSQADISDSHFQIIPAQWVNVKTSETMPLGDLKIAGNALAIAGIGNPGKFLVTLKQLDIDCDHKWFADHYVYKQDDFDGVDRQILMTEKDAVKIKPFARDDMWYLQISANLPSAFLQSLKMNLDKWKKNHG